MRSVMSYVCSSIPASFSWNLHLRASALQIFLQRICVTEFSATQMQRQKFCNADAPSAKPTKSYVHPLQRICNAEKSAMQMQVRKICNADATQMHADAQNLHGNFRNLHGNSRNMHGNFRTSYIRVHPRDKKIKSNPVIQHRYTEQQKLDFPQPH